MENPEEILHSLEEFSKFRPKDIPRELEEYLCFVAKTGDPVYQWSSIKHLFKEKLINVVNEFYESCPLVDIPPCPNVELFNYDTMKSFILEKLDTFAAAPFTVQRICELLTAPRKEYNRIDKFMRALEKNILVVSTVEPGCKNAENGESIVNGLETEHLPETSNSSTEINVVEMEESPVWQKSEQMEMQFQSTEEAAPAESQDTLTEEAKENEKELCTCTSSQDTVETVEKSSEENQIEHISVEPPSVSSVEESTDKSIPTDINTDALPSTHVESDNSEPVVSSEIVDEITESEEVSTNYPKEEQETVSEAEITTENNDQESLKQADSTTSSKLPLEELVPTVFRFELKKCSEPIDEQDTHCEIASSDTENADTGSTSNLSSVSTEADTANQGPIDHTAAIINDTEKTVDEDLQEENAVDNEDSNSPPAADTTRGYERQIDNDFGDKSEDNKDEEITSSDKVVVAVPNTSIDDISDDESEAEAEIQKETSMEIVSEQSDILPNAETPENDSVVTASSDDLRKDCEDTPMEVDSKDKADFNEAEATCSNCESI